MYGDKDIHVDYDDKDDYVLDWYDQESKNI